jgi:hypothetical protein
LRNKEERTGGHGQEKGIESLKGKFMGRRKEKEGITGRKGQGALG